MWMPYTNPLTPDFSIVETMYFETKTHGFNGDMVLIFCYIYTYPHKSPRIITIAVVHLSSSFKESSQGNPNQIIAVLLPPPSSSKKITSFGNMRMSCNGCRVLRKGCSEDCTIRPCLQWIKNPESQGHATVFLAKFYGRAGLLNLINAGSDNLRPAIFRSLLYEACGRIVNPIYGSVGLLWSGNWQLCQAAVEAVLKGAPIIQIPSEKAAAIPMPPLKAFDIRHVNKNTTTTGTNASIGDLHMVSKSSRTPFKRSGSANSSNSNTQRQRQEESSGSHDHNCASGGGRTTTSSDSMVSAEVVEPSTPEQKMTDEVELDLTLGLGSPVKKVSSPGSTPSCRSPAMKKISSDGHRFDLALDLTV